jgi:hypothetical protein
VGAFKSKGEATWYVVSGLFQMYRSAMLPCMKSEPPERAKSVMAALKAYCVSRCTCTHASAGIRAQLMDPSRRASMCMDDHEMPTEERLKYASESPPDRPSSRYGLDAAWREGVEHTASGCVREREREREREKKEREREREREREPHAPVKKCRI